VLHLGCGLDSRVFRIDPLATVHWYDIDFPDVIELRRRLYPERHDYTLIPASVTEAGWLDAISSSGVETSGLDHQLCLDTVTVGTD
jgi:O-methyltransferase involved in polyketide biosynthesis